MAVFEYTIVIWLNKPKFSSPQNGDRVWTKPHRWTPTPSPRSFKAISPLKWRWVTPPTRPYRATKASALLKLVSIVIVYNKLLVIPYEDWRLNIPFSVFTAFDLSKHYFILHIILIIIITCTLTILLLFFNLYNYLRRWYKRRYENQAVICSILFTLFLPEMMPPPPQPPPQGDPPPQTFTEYVYKPRLSQLTQC